MSAEHAVELQERSWSLHAEGRLDEAREAARAAVQLMEDAEGPDSPDVANLLTDLAEIECDRRELAAALICAERANSIEEALAERLRGATAVQMRLRTLAVLGTLWRMRGEYSRAVGYLGTAVRIACSSFGNASEAAALARNDLGVVCKFLGLFAAGRKLYEDALGALRLLHGDESLACATVYHNLGGLLHAQGAFAEAEPPARRAWEISRAQLGESETRVWLDAIAYAAVLEGLRRYEDCEQIYRVALPVLQEKLGPDHAEVAALWHNLAAVREARGDMQSAEDLYRQALALREAALGNEHPEVALTINNLGRLLADCGRRSEAQALLRRAITMLEHSLGAENPYLAAARANLARAGG